MCLAVTAAVLDLDHRAAVDEEPGHVDGIAEDAAAVAPQIEDDARDLLVRELTQDLVDVARGAALALALTAVEARHVDVAVRRAALLR